MSEVKKKGMESLRELYKVGCGPSSSHTMGPEKAARIFKKCYPMADRFRVVLYGSLAGTGKGHCTDMVIKKHWRLFPVKSFLISTRTSGSSRTQTRWIFLPIKRIVSSVKTAFTAWEVVRFVLKGPQQWLRSRFTPIPLLKKSPLIARKGIGTSGSISRKRKERISGITWLTFGMP